MTMTKRGHTMLESPDERFIRWRTPRNTNAKAGDFEVVRRRGWREVIVFTAGWTLVTIGAGVLGAMAWQYAMLRFCS